MLPNLLSCLMGLLLISLACGEEMDRNNAFHISYRTQSSSLPDGSLKMKMGFSETLTLVLQVDNSTGVLKDEPKYALLSLRAVTLLPQFDIVQINNWSEPTKEELYLEFNNTEGMIYQAMSEITLRARYIGRALILTDRIALSNQKDMSKSQVYRVTGSDPLQVKITRDEGIWGPIFVSAVAFLMILIYLNLGAQIDLDNVKALLSRPKTITAGFFICILTMPVVSWLTFWLLLPNQPLHRIGSYVFACGPAALASTPWTELLGGDKELSMGLQIMTTVSATFTMPLLLHLMELSIDGQDSLEGKFISVPYSRLVGLSVVLLVTLLAGFRFIGSNPRLRKISARIYRPLTLVILIAIIVSSSLIYRHLYRMFDITITLASLVTILVSLIIGSLLGLIINCNRRHALAIGISSIHKNEGIAFAVLLVALEQPDNQVAYVACLTQILLTSVFFATVKLSLRLIHCARRRNQPAPIQASEPTAECSPDEQTQVT